jgi:UDP-3-O-[3-hydroxymyristoyl] N-acetylglucosamine deacetylase
MLMPHSVPRVSMCIDFPDTVIGSQCFSVDLSGDAYFEEIAYARTFGFSDKIEELRKQGLAQGGSLINAVVVDGDTVRNPEGLRASNEFVRHKILDVIGDMSLAGAPIIGHYYGYKSGHTLNNKLLNTLFSDPSAWTMTSLEEGSKTIASHDELYDSEFIKKTIEKVPLKIIA